MKLKLFTLLFATTLTMLTTGQALAKDALLKEAIAGKHRSAAHVARDTARHPYKTLRFFGIKPTMTVVELVPEGGWYTEILAPYLREKGRLIGAGESLKVEKPGASALMFKKLLDSNPAVYDKVETGVFEPPANFDIAKPNSVDMVLTFRNVHNWVEFGDDGVKSTFKAVYSSLKKGGIFGVVDHRLPAKMPQDEDAQSGYIHESYVIRLAKAAGFRLLAKSQVNANPKDRANHDKGVWALPPTFANQEVDKAKYAAIGESDRMTLKFIKP